MAEGRGVFVVTIGSLFSGIGGLELGLEMCGLGPVLWQCDADPQARAVLAHHWPEVKRYDDVRDIDASAAPVGLVCGGFPCQPHSLAGKRRGTSDERWLWPEFARVIECVRPGVVFIENVPGLRTSGLRDVLADLAHLGFDAEWGVFGAYEVGAPHLRRRLFVLAYANGEPELLQPRRGSGPCWPDSMGPGRNGSAGHVADAAGPGRPGAEAGKERAGFHAAEPGSEALAHANGQGELQQGGSVGVEWGRIGDGGGTVDVADSDGVPEQQSDAEAGPVVAGRAWTRDAVGGSGWWAAEPDVGRVVARLPARLARLRLLGNACVPAQAALAYRELSARATANRRAA